jgi:hypothetical protein
MAKLEGADAPITLRRAAEIAGLTPNSLRRAAVDGRLEAKHIGRDWTTTRKLLHRYLAGRRTGAIPPLPEDYETPRGEPQIEGASRGRPSLERGRMPSTVATRSGHPLADSGRV